MIPEAGTGWRPGSADVVSDAERLLDAPEVAVLLHVTERWVHSATRENRLLRKRKPRSSRGLRDRGDGTRTCSSRFWRPMLNGCFAGVFCRPRSRVSNRVANRVSWRVSYSIRMCVAERALGVEFGHLERTNQLLADVGWGMERQADVFPGRVSRLDNHVTFF